MVEQPTFIDIIPNNHKSMRCLRNIRIEPAAKTILNLDETSWTLNCQSEIFIYLKKQSRKIILFLLSLNDRSCLNCYLCRISFTQPILRFGAVLKRFPHKVGKIDPSPLVRTGSNLPLLSFRTHHKFWKFRVFLHQKVRIFTSEEPPCPQNIRTGHLGLWVFYG